MHCTGNSFPRRSPTDIEREALNKRYGELVLQHKFVRRELSYRSGSEKVLKERESESILQQIKEVDAKLEALDGESRDSNRNYLSLEEELQKIDFNEVKKVVERIISQIHLNREGGNASFLLQRSLAMAGRLCLLQIKDQPRRDTRDLKSYPIEFSADTELNHIGLLNRLANHLGIELIADPVEYSASIQQAIVRSLQSGSK